MKITKFKSLYQMSYLSGLFSINIYLVDEGEQLTLIDSGLPFLTSEILAFSDKLQKPISNIALTHCHFDHIGGLQSLRKKLPNAKIYIPAREVRILNGDYSLEQSEPQIPLKGGYPKNKNIPFDGTVKHRDRIESLTAISTPGHTPGSISYYSISDGFLLTGDAMQTKGGVAVAGKINWRYPFPALATWSKELSLKSAQSILDLNPKAIGPGHGNLLFDPQLKLEKAITDLKKKIGGFDGSHAS
ncbi:MAG: MBL fold metallo-hydrolase [Lachnospiraceae bacterium]